MTTLVFDSFKEAQALAKCCAFRFEVEACVKPSNGVFVVHFPDQLRIQDVRDFTRRTYLFGMSPDMNLLSLMSYVDRSPFASVDLAWRDTGTGLAWDITRLFYGSGHSEHPAPGQELMNALQYAGLSQWRLPTLDELKTLSASQLASASPDGKTDWVSNVWSCEESFYTGPEKAFLDIQSHTTGHQRFIEQNRDKKTHGDGYTESAQTVMVCSFRTE